MKIWLIILGIYVGIPLFIGMFVGAVMFGAFKLNFNLLTLIIGLIILYPISEILIGLCEIKLGI